MAVCYRSLKGTLCICVYDNSSRVANATLMPELVTACELAITRLTSEGIPIQKVLQTVAITVNYSPMFAVLFLTVRMRVTWLTQGKGHPPVWMQVIGVDQQTGDIDEDVKTSDHFIRAACFTVFKYFIMIGLYVCVICIIYGAALTVL